MLIFHTLLLKKISSSIEIILLLNSDVDKNAESISDMAVNIAKIIRESEERKFSNVEFFLMQKDIEILKAAVCNINRRNLRIM